MNKHFIFVYGTLRRGGLREMSRLFPGARFVAEARVCGSLYDLGEHPGLLLDGSESLVTGEVYEIDDEILHELDEIEASTDYSRKQVEVSLDDRSVRCWVYVENSGSYAGRLFIAHGDWLAYAGTKTGPTN